MMKKFILFSLISLVISMTLSAQDFDRLMVKRSPLTNILRFYYDDGFIRKNEAASLLRSDSVSAALFKSYKTNTTIATCLYIAGDVAFLVGFYYFWDTVLICDDDFSKAKIWGTVGLVTIVGGAVFKFISLDQVERAVDIYNKNAAADAGHSLSISFGITDDGIGVSLRF